MWVDILTKVLPKSKHQSMCYYSWMYRLQWFVARRFRKHHQIMKWCSWRGSVIIHFNWLASLISLHHMICRNLSLFLGYKYSCKFIQYMWNTFSFIHNQIAFPPCNFFLSCFLLHLAILFRPHTLLFHLVTASCCHALSFHLIVKPYHITSSCCALLHCLLFVPC